MKKNEILKYGKVQIEYYCCAVQFNKLIRLLIQFQSVGIANAYSFKNKIVQIKIKIKSNSSIVLFFLKN